MRIAVNTRLLIAGRLDGIGWFTAETVRRIVIQHPEHEFFLFFDRPPAQEFRFAPNAHLVTLRPPARHPVLWYLFFEWSLRRALKQYRIDILLSTDGWIPLHTDVPMLTVIHDINFEHSRHNLRRSHQLYMEHFFPKFAQKAARIATVSQFSKEDISHTYQVPLEKIDVVWDGAHVDYRPCTESEKAQTRASFTGGSPYFIFISTIIRRKNLANLLLAFDRFKASDTQNTKLVVVGSRVWWKDELKEAYEHMRYASDVVFLGRVEAHDLAALLGSAIALVYPSFFEGFGIPILEAFYAETAVITSNISSMPEVAGDAALLVDPHSVDEIASSMQQLATDSERRSDLIDKGRLQRQKFSWDITAELLWKSLMNISSRHA